MSDIQLYSFDECNTIPFPSTYEGEYARGFFEAFMKEGAKKFISNIETQIYCLKIDDHFFPVTVNKAEYDNSYVTSPFGIIKYAQEELKRFDHWFLTPLLKPILRIIGKFLKKGKINQVVSVNNWLLSTNLYPQIIPKQISEAVVLLQKRFPSHCILWRSINRTYPHNLLEHFKELPCRLLFSRQIYFYNPFNKNSLNSKQRWNIKNDRKLIQLNDYEVVTGDKIKTEDIPRIKELYDLLYLKKYTALNPQFTEEFIRLAIDKKLLTIIAIRKNRKIDGIIGYFTKENVMTTPLLGYDTALPQKVGLYRMLTAICIDEADRNRILLHHSSGAAHFKRVRGMTADREYTAVFHKHLFKRRQIIWALLTSFFNKVGEPILTQFKL
ncbi:MAG: hypothetical protein SNF33_01990 [Candidatus Algichlamydia australiensis]|nr:hypothetical protein [Chlamydiales bacterium]